MNHPPFFIGIAGGTGSGKTYLCDKLSCHLGKENTVCIEVDAYYRDLSHIPINERAAVNFDHPGSLETELLRSHLETLARGNAVPKPVYDFATHTRTDQTTTVPPRPFVLAEGILLLALEGIGDYLDFTIYLDVPADIRFIRRLERDLKERGRTTETVISQYLDQARPMHEKFVAPCRNTADLVIYQDYDISDVAQKIRAAAKDTGCR